jgi:adenylate cyclase
LVKRLRLISGLVLLVFVTGHLLNHALGLISLQAMEDGRALFLGVWRSPPFTILLVVATLGHVVLVLWALYQRRSLKLRPSEIAQSITGIAIPLLLMSHFVGTRGIHEL